MSVQTFRYVHVDDLDDALFERDFEDTPTSPAYRAAEEWAEELRLNVAEIDGDARLVIVDTPVGYCDGCDSEHVFLPGHQDVVLGDGSIDDTFRFCPDCTVKGA